jgi:hypothetical protein
MTLGSALASRRFGEWEAYNIIAAVAGKWALEQ